MINYALATHQNIYRFQRISFRVLFQLRNKFSLTVQVDRDEYHRSTSCQRRR